ncbi:NAD(P)/FAD-dependent oxidoreductase [Rhodopirellula sp. MGV]|uniref:NAD(P)/FAD-dependent oxidoreductase n=1 Tax=Rhodopirellula sp. MGV TaxID=2023130 RepID=UPI000B97B55A|nr:NAD(P)/FAD-dependent oxidoreductase [Rhodopirellula sp. MGV]OYP32938.1 oxidoreductase [Rhodopirellula sp. MGV]PNY35405.1 FAD-dependent oxidoreductase [Rhodopirellula baltica]
MSGNLSNSLETVIIGAGLSGLACAQTLCSAGRTALVLEASDRVGGRVRTDRVDGLALDHGFQVLLTAYPACEKLLDYDALRLRPFRPGALVRKGGRFVPLADPWRQPAKAIACATSPVGTLGDKLRVGKLRSDCRRGTLDGVYSRTNESTKSRLESAGLSDPFIDEFFRPFLGGVFLDESLETSRRMFDFVFRMFASGQIAVPADGMAAIPRQLVETLPRGTIQFNTTVRSIEHHEIGSRLTLSDGQTIEAKQVVVATESDAAARLLGIEKLKTDWNEALTMYFRAPKSPENSRMLMLRGDETGPIQTMTVISDIAPEYAPNDTTLISVSVSADQMAQDCERLSDLVLKQATSWFGDQVGQWEFVRSYRIPYALPRLDLQTVVKTVRASEIDGGCPDHVYVCGDHRETPSINGALSSGMRVAARLLTTRLLGAI